MEKTDMFRPAGRFLSADLEWYREVQMQQEVEGPGQSWAVLEGRCPVRRRGEKEGRKEGHC